MFLNSSQPQAQGQFSFRILLYPTLLAAIETIRTGDLEGVATIWFHFVYTSQGAGGVWNLLDQRNAFPIQLNYSRDEWCKLLEDVGYSGAWVVEVPRPRVVGWEEIEAKLQEAERELRNHQPQRAALACRGAWELAKPILGAKWERVRDIINRGSKAPGEYTLKADRVVSIYNDVDLIWNDVRYLADIAAHSAKHSICDDDALLIYRMSHVLLAYLSQSIRQTQS
jgi:hypothetical protein